MASFIRMFVAGITLAAAVANPVVAEAKGFKPMMGKEYFVSYYHGLPGGPVYNMTPHELDLLTYLDLMCQRDMKAQRPSGFSEVFHTTFVGALGGGLGHGAGYAAAGYNGDTVGKGATLGGVAGAVGGFVGGLDGRGRAKRYDQGQCMVYAVSMAQRIDHVLLRVGIVINTHAVNGKGMKNVPMSATEAYDPAAAAAAADNNQAPATMIP